MDLSKDIVLKAAQLLVDIQERRLHISLNMVVCLSNKDPNQPDRWLTNSPQASNTLVNKVMVLHLPSLQVNTKINKWEATEVLLVPADMVVVLSKRPMRNGLPRLHNKASETVSVAIKDDNTLSTIRNSPLRMYLAFYGLQMGYKFWASFSLVSALLLTSMLG